ncbi:hypothetical protein SAMN05444000_1122 [Shimia gijangensis]|uniref:Uncharacterized protein n=1 Tax=Shimia gijangensis TaxID=1470563 RepID=A0A1M6LHL2_9RHOB|nr:hypothetical protein [Shimia gijangensis]SHJ70681.1 hypothetical protein SAMN05444000_1122 [Shimia gijangensis]
MKDNAERRQYAPIEKLFPSLLIDFHWARVVELQDLGHDERTACLMAMLEIEHRKALALEIGPHRAFLARLVRTSDQNAYWCSLKYDEPPHNLEEMPFRGFR